MKKLFLALFILATTVTFGQYVAPNYPYNGYGKPAQYPVYYPYNTPGTYLTYSYDSTGTPSNDTIRATLNGATVAKHLVYVTHNIVLLFDTTGDTLLHATQWSNQHWYKKTPFSGLPNSPAHQMDELNYTFISGSTSSKYQVKVPWFNGGLAGDTIHVPVSTSTGGGASIKATYINQKSNLIWSSYTTW